MKEYDVIVIGSGSGASIAEAALKQGSKVALVDKGPLGGTCLNLGCIPSKMLIHPADRIKRIKNSKKLGISSKITNIDFNWIINRMRKTVDKSQKHMRQGIKQTVNLDLYEKTGYFIDDYTMKVGNEKIKADKIFIVSGARPLIPPIKGLDKAKYLTNKSILNLKKPPKTIVIIGGGYVAAEYSHFLSSMGTKVTLVQRNKRLVPDEEPEISEFLKKKLGECVNIYTNTEVHEVKKKKNGYSVLGGKKEFSSENIMVATGRKPNSDLLKPEKTGVETDNRGFIKVNKYFETTKENIWALGDAIGKGMFKHVANREAVLAWHNSVHDHKAGMDYNAVPHAVYSYPQIASVGMREKEAKKKYNVLVGRANYSDVAKGEAMGEDGFTKAVVDKDTGKILGFHIIGPYAPILIQEVINTIANKDNISSIMKSLHIHPSLPEVIIDTLSDLR